MCYPDLTAMGLVHRVIVLFSGVSVGLITSTYMLNITLAPQRSQAYVNLYEFSFLPAEQSIVNFTIMLVSLYRIREWPSVHSRWYRLMRLFFGIALAVSLVVFDVISGIRFSEMAAEALGEGAAGQRVCDIMDQVGRINEQPCGTFVFISVIELLTALLVLIESGWTFQTSSHEGLCKAIRSHKTPSQAAQSDQETDLEEPEGSLQDQRQRRCRELYRLRRSCYSLTPPTDHHGHRPLREPHSDPEIERLCSRARYGCCPAAADGTPVVEALPLYERNADRVASFSTDSRAAGPRANVSSSVLRSATAAVPEEVRPLPPAYTR